MIAAIRQISLWIGQWMALVRGYNLLILMLVLYVVYDLFILTSLNEYDIPPILTLAEVGLLICICLCIAAGGYVHNDQMDKKADQFNSKSKPAISKLGDKHVHLMYIFFWFIPVPGVLYLSFQVNHPEYALLYFLTIVLIVLYNRSVKGVPLLGNLVVSLLCAAVVGVPILAEWPSLRILANRDSALFQKLVICVVVLMLFAFFITLIREIIKDMEDAEGDRLAGYNTLPVLVGTERTKLTVYAVFLIMGALLVFLTMVLSLKGSLWLTAAYMGCLMFPFVYLGYSMYLARKKVDFNQISNGYKYYMLSGIIFTLIYWYL